MNHIRLHIHALRWSGGHLQRNNNHAINPYIEASQIIKTLNHGLALNIDAVNIQRLINEACQKMNKIVYQDIQ